MTLRAVFRSVAGATKFSNILEAVTDNRSGMFERTQYVELDRA